MHIVTVEGISKVRKAQIRKAIAGLPQVQLKDEAGKITGTAQPVYVSHKTTIPGVVFTRNPKFRRATSPWKLRVAQKPAVTVIQCKLEPVA